MNALAMFLLSVLAGAVAMFVMLVVVASFIAWESGRQHPLKDGLTIVTAMLGLAVIKVPNPIEAKDVYRWMSIADGLPPIWVRVGANYADGRRFRLGRSFGSPP